MTELCERSVVYALRPLCVLSVLSFYSSRAKYGLTLYRHTRVLVDLPVRATRSFGMLMRRACRVFRRLIVQFWITFRFRFVQTCLWSFVRWRCYRWWWYRERSKRTLLTLNGRITLWRIFSSFRIHTEKYIFRYFVSLCIRESITRSYHKYHIYSEYILNLSKLSVSMEDIK